MIYVSKIKASELLLKSGYIVHYKGFVKHDVGGRFHAYVKGQRNISIHYDLYVAKGRRHFAPPMPMKVGEEVKRLQKLDLQYVQESFQKTEEELEKLKTKNLVKVLQREKNRLLTEPQA